MLLAGKATQLRWPATAKCGQVCAPSAAGPLAFALAVRLLSGVWALANFACCLSSLGARIL